MPLIITTATTEHYLVQKLARISVCINGTFEIRRIVEKHGGVCLLQGFRQHGFL
jgi:hypothetical protein